ncbi:MAG: hypothetical protein ACPLPT_00720 [Moorellales bacterium]
MREVSRRELINYVRVAGSYPGYTEAERAALSVFAALQECLEPQTAEVMATNLPRDLLSLWLEAGRDEGQGSHRGQTEAAVPRGNDLLLLTLISEHGGYPDEATAERALLAVFSALKEKLQERAASWGENLPPIARSFWRRARTVDEQQDASQCL